MELGRCSRRRVRSSHITSFPDHSSLRSNDCLLTSHLCNNTTRSFDIYLSSFPAYNFMIYLFLDSYRYRNSPADSAEKSLVWHSFVFEPVREIKSIPDYDLTHNTHQIYLTTNTTNTGPHIHHHVRRQKRKPCQTASQQRKCQQRERKESHGNRCFCKNSCF